jgi:exosome complex RNA-binding protein Csl4
MFCQVEGCGQKPVVPATGDIVTLRVLSVNPRFAKVRIPYMLVGD